MWIEVCQQKTLEIYCVKKENLKKQEKMKVSHSPQKLTWSDLAIERREKYQKQRWYEKPSKP